MTAFERMREELRAWSNQAGMSPSVLLALNEPLRGALKRIMRQGSMTIDELGVALELDAPQTEVIAELLVTCGLLRTTEQGADGETTYRIRHASNHRPESPAAVWSLLLGPEAEEGATE